MSKVYTRTTVDKVTLKGVMNDEATTITFEDKDDTGNKVERTLKIQDYLNQFASSEVNITIQNKSEEELEIEDSEEDSDEE